MKTKTVGRVGMATSALLIAGCGAAVAGGTASSVGVSPDPAPSESVSTVQVPSSAMWNLPSGLQTFAASDVSAAQASIPFASVVPSLPGSVTSLYDVPMDPPAFIVDYAVSGERALSDHRVRLIETADSRSDADLVASYENRVVGPTVSVVTLAGTQVVLLTNGDLSRVQFIHSGVRFDLTGPSVPAAVSQDLASRILQQLN